MEYYKKEIKMAQEAAPDLSPLMAEFNTILRDLEEKQSTLKDRTLLIGQNLIETRDLYDKKLSEMKKDIESLKQSLSSIKTAIETISDQISSFARKEDVAMLYRQAKIFDPLKFATIEEVTQMLQKKAKE